MKEEWRPVKGYEGLYEVSNTARARSVDRYDHRGTFRKGVELKIRIYEEEPYVRLSRYGRSVERNLYRLMSKVFEASEWKLDDEK